MMTTARPGLPGWELPWSGRIGARKEHRFPALVGPLRSGVGLWNRGFGTKTAQFLRHFCVIKRVAPPPAETGPKLTVSLPFLDRNGGGGVGEPLLIKGFVGVG